VTFPSAVPVLTDGVVTLRAHREEDVEDLLEQALDPLVVEWTTVPVPSTIETSRVFATQIIPAGWETGTSWAFAVQAVDGAGRERFAGTVELRPESDHRAEIAYAAHPWARGRGPMERACRLAMKWAFEVQQVETIIWWANRGNWASRRLAWKLGFSCDGTLARWLPQRGRLLDAWVGTLGASEERTPRNPWYDVPNVTGRSVALRPYLPTDPDRIVQACADERTAYWLSRMPQPYTRADAEEYVLRRREVAAEGSALHWAVADPATNELIANIALFDIVPGHGAEIGFWTHPEARGRGVMTEACGLVVRHAFVPVEDGGLGLERVAVRASEGNSASRRVIEANGFVEVGRDRRGTRLRDDRLVDSITYDLLREEWSGPRDQV